MAKHIPAHIKGKMARHQYAVELLESLIAGFEADAEEYTDSTYRAHAEGRAGAYKDALEMLREITEEGE